MNKKKLYIHIGQAKTASSTIQNFLCENRSVLKEAGYFFPVIEDSELHEKRIWANARYLCRSLMGQTSLKPSDAWKRFYADPFEQSSCHSLVITDELFSFSPASILSPIDFSNFDVKIIVYIRPSIEYLTSAWAQATKSKFYKNLNGNLSLNEFLEQEYVVPDIVLSYAEKFGNDNIILRTLENESLINGNVYDDILSCLGVKSDKFIKTDSKNLSLGRGTAEIARLINLLNLPLDEHQALKTELIDNNKGLPKIIDTIPIETVKRITDKNRDKENQLSQKLLNRDKLFVNDYPKTKFECGHFTLDLTDIEILQRAINIKDQPSITPISPLQKLKLTVKKYPTIMKLYYFIRTKGIIR